MAKREIKWTSRALRDKIGIMEYWYQRNKSVDYPLKLEQLFSSSLSLLIHQPFAGTFYDIKRNIRFVLVRSYKIFYTFDENQLTVLAIWDTRRDKSGFEV